MLKSYSVTSENVEQLRSALERLIEYSKFLEDETGRSTQSFIDEILKEESILVEECVVIDE